MVDEKVRGFHDFDPWDMLVDLQNNLIRQQNSINTIAQAHNVNQTQVNALIVTVDQQRREITRLQAEINRLSLNIKKDFPNG